MCTDIKIVCFGSGDFPVKTFEYLVKNYNVVGIVTSKDKVVFGDKRVYDIAIENGIPVCMPDNLESDDFLEWLDSVNGNVYCVVSYKYLPKCVREKASELAFNIHASLLPLLRGAAPINWAIRYGFKNTGITAITLADKIDTGKIIKAWDVDIHDNDTFKELHERLSTLSVEMTASVIDDIKYGSIRFNSQGVVPIYKDSEIFHAPKLNKENTTFRYYDGPFADATDIHNMIRSLAPNIGTTFNMTLRKIDKDLLDNKDLLNNEAKEVSCKDVKKFTFKVYESAVVNKSIDWVNSHSGGSDIITDWKNYLYIIPMFGVDCGLLSIKKIQLPGKRILDIKEFLKGFQVYNKPDYSFLLF